MVDKTYRLNELADPKQFHDGVIVSDFPPDYYHTALYKMILIRRSEEIIGEHVEKGLIRCPCHLSIGQEAIPVGVSQFLSKSDYVFGNHRSHGHYLAMNQDVHSLFAEVLGKITGCSKGMGGSMHIISRDTGFIGSVPIISATIPVAVGAALSVKLRGANSIAVSYFGDGTTEEGSFHESLNLASYYKLPILFVCENNLFSSHMHINERQPFDSVARFAHAHGIEHKSIDGNDVNIVFKTAKYAVGYVRNGNGPFFIEAVTYRWRGHVGPDENIDVGLRRKEDLREWRKRDPIGRLLKNMILNNLISEDENEKVSNNIDRLVKKEWDRAIQDPYPEHAQLLDTVYFNKR